tara:strand:- start:45 stop:233 length:189 start_codon:yes stop_codon:yes gene_type:complete
MNPTNHSLSPLQQIFAGKHEEAQELLTMLEENATELCVDLRIFRDCLIELESMRTELATKVS